jgi:hypothetical protein
LSWLVLWATLLGCLALGTRVHAQQAQRHGLDAALELRAGATCLDKERVLAHIKMWLSHEPMTSALRIRVVGDAKDRQRVSYEIQRDGRVGRREFHPAPSSCDDLHAILGLMIALALDSERLQQTWLAQEPPRQLPVLLTTQLSASQGMLLDFALGLQLGVDIGLSPLLHLRGEVLAQLAWDNKIAGSRGSFDLWLPAAAFAVCAGGQAQPRLRLALCSGFVAGAVIAKGSGYSPNYTEVGASLAWRSGVRFELDLGLRWLVDLEVVSRIYYPAFQADSRDGALRREPNVAGLALSIGPALTF